MATPLLISYPDIPLRAVNIAPDQTYLSLLPHYNLFRGWRYQHAKLAAATSSPRVFEFTLNDGDESAVDHYILARADLLLDQGATTFELEESTNGSSWTGVRSDSLGTGSLTGVRSQDIIQTFSTTVSRKYWRAAVLGASAATEYSKLYFGRFFDFGCAPDEFTFDRRPEGDSVFLADSGAQHYQKLNEPRYTFRIVWDGVADAKADAFATTIAAMRKRTGFFLYTASQPQILNDHELVHVMLTSVSIEEQVGYPDWNRIVTEWVELI